MPTPLLTLRIRSKHDVLAARQRARQVAGLVGFDARGRMAVAAAVFAMASEVCRPNGRGSLVFQLAGETLHVLPRVEGRGPADTPARPLDPVGTARLLRRLGRPGAVGTRAADGLSLRLPPQRSALTPDDLALAVHQLAQITPLDVFEEIERQNQELLEALNELRGAEAGRDRPRSRAAAPAA